jgi:large subunit ribosomal protein L30
MSKIRVKLVKSPIHRPARQKKTLKALGLNKLQSSVEIEDTPQVKGMVDSIKHLLSVEQI